MDTGYYGYWILDNMLDTMDTMDTGYYGYWIIWILDTG
jgi:hypothetical protein